DVAVELAARLVTRSDREARRPRLGLAAESVLRRGVDLPLELAEVADRQVLGLEPPQEHVIILGGASEMNMVFSREPRPAPRGGPIQAGGTSTANDDGAAEGKARTVIACAVIDRHDITTRSPPLRPRQSHGDGMVSHSHRRRRVGDRPDRCQVTPPAFFLDTI